MLRYNVYPLLASMVCSTFLLDHTHDISSFMLSCTSPQIKLKFEHLIPPLLYSLLCSSRFSCKQNHPPIQCSDIQVLKSYVL